MPGIELGTAIVPTLSRHPLVMASQALTAQAACGGRLTLGIGPSHQRASEGLMGIPYPRPARHTREYLIVLRALCDSGEVEFSGELIRANTLLGPHPVADAATIPILVAALAPAMVRLAGELAEGTVTWMATAGVLGERIVPALNDTVRVAASKGASPMRKLVLLVAPVPFLLAPPALAEDASEAESICRPPEVDHRYDTEDCGWTCGCRHRVVRPGRTPCSWSPPS